MTGVMEDPMFKLTNLCSCCRLQVDPGLQRVDLGAHAWGRGQACHDLRISGPWVEWVDEHELRWRFPIHAVLPQIDGVSVMENPMKIQ